MDGGSRVSGFKTALEPSFASAWLHELEKVIYLLSVLFLMYKLAIIAKYNFIGLL